MSNEIDRRKYLELIATTGAVGGTAGLAGCGGGGETTTDSPDTDTPESGGGETETPTEPESGGGETETPTETEEGISSQFPLEGTFDIGLGIVPNEGQYNPYNPKRLMIGPNNTPNQVLYDELWQPLPKTGEDYMEQGTLLTGRSYEPDNKLVTLNIREDAKWHNGDSYTARDLVTHYKLEQYVNDAVGQVESFSIKDDKTVELSLKKVINTELLWNSLQLEGNVKHSQFKSWLQKFEDATTDSERNTILANIQKYTIEEPIGNGPFRFERANSQELLLTHFEGYHVPVPFTKYKYNYLSGANAIVSAFLSNKLDGQAHIPLPKATQKQLPDGITKIKAGSANGGWSLRTNMDHSFLGKRKVRKAIAHLLDRHTMAKNTLPSHGYVKYMVGLTNKSAPDWLGDKLDQYERYEGSNTERAMELLNEAGYSKKGGKVVGPDGKQVSFTLLTPTWKNPRRMSETARKTLENFGIKVEFSSVPGTQFSNRRSNADYDMAPFYWWAPHPHGGYRRAFITHKSAVNNKTTVTVPTMGDSSGTKTVDVKAKLDDLLTATDREKAQSIVQDIAWVYNEYLPTLPMTQGITTTYIDTKEWHSPPEDSKHYDPLYPTEWWVRTGDLYPVQ
ncbi:MAG: ABC transporter substrate-binding protein [Halorhabdus sp.]